MANTYSEEVKLVAQAGEIPFAKGLEGVPVGESTKSFVTGWGGSSSTTGIRSRSCARNRTTKRWSTCSSTTACRRNPSLRISAG